MDGGRGQVNIALGDILEKLGAGDSCLRMVKDDHHRTLWTLF